MKVSQFHKIIVQELCFVFSATATRYLIPTVSHVKSCACDHDEYQMLSADSTTLSYAILSLNHSDDSMTWTLMNRGMLLRVSRVSGVGVLVSSVDCGRTCA